MINIPDDDIPVTFKRHNYGRNFEALATHKTSGPTFRHAARIDAYFIDANGRDQLVSDAELKRLGELGANAARAGVVKKIRAHLAIINPIDND